MPVNARMASVKWISIVEMLGRLLEAVLKALARRRHESEIEDIKRDPAGWAIEHFGGVRSNAEDGAVSTSETDAND